MREKGSKLSYVAPVSDMLVCYDDIPLCQSGNVVIDPDYDSEYDFPFP